MLYGLAHKEEEFYAEHLHKAVFFAPCTILGGLGDESYHASTTF